MASRGALSTLARTPDAIVGRSYLALVPRRFRRDTVRRLRALLADPTAQDGPHEVDVWVTRGDGTELPLRLRFARSEAPREGWVVLLGASSDPLAHRERIALRALADLPEGVVAADADGLVVYANRAAEALVGAAVGAALARLWGPGAKELATDGRTPLTPEASPLARACAGDRVDGLRVVVRRPDDAGDLHLVCHAAPLAGADGEGPSGTVVIFRDVSQRHATEQALEASRRWQEAILDNLPDIAWLKDRDGRFRSVNRAFTTSVGRPTDAIVGLTDLDLFPRELAERYQRDDDEVMRHGSVKIVEEPYVDGRGTRRIIETFKKVVLDEHGAVEGTVGLARDITERLAYEETLRSLNDELERRVAERSEELARAQEALLRRERLAVLGQLAGGVAHQIRNPLAAIQNAAHVLERRLGRQAHGDVSLALEAIYEEVRRSNEIITGLLDYARVRAPQRRSVRPGEIVDRVLAATPLPEGVRVERHDGDVPALEVDVDQIQGALDNLVRNALEAMPDGGALRVEVRREGAEVVFEVADEGAGISPLMRGRLFEPLLTTKPAGIGLGLVTARTLAEAHGGTIRAVDTPRGARFELRLPAGA